MPTEKTELRDRDDECCELWAAYMPVIDSYMTLSRSLTALSPYDGPPFRHCPFCGESREKPDIGWGGLRLPTQTTRM